MLSFTMTFGGIITIQTFVDGMKEWMSHIEIDKDKYAIEILSGFDSYPLYGRIAVKYVNRILFYVNFFKKYGRSVKGKKIINGVFTLTIKNEGIDFYQGKRLTLNVNDKLDAYYNGKKTGIVEALCELLPIRNEEKVETITTAFNISPDYIKLDTYRKRYVIDIAIPEFALTQSKAPSTYYKYISLSTFHRILTNRTFRMHSIVSQSDYTESLYLGDLLSADYENEEDRFKGVLNEKSVLITSFTDKNDDPYMWEHYGDNGKGVCLSFRTIDNRPLTNIIYVDKSTTPLWKYREATNKLKDEGIRIHFNAVDKYHRFVKDYEFRNEQEWRLVLENQSDLQTAVYDDERMVWYKDFPFDGTILRDTYLQLQGILIGPNQQKNNFPILTDSIIHTFGNKIVVNRSKCLE